MNFTPQLLWTLGFSLLLLRTRIAFTFDFGDQFVVILKLFVVNIPHAPNAPAAATVPRQRLLRRRRQHHLLLLLLFLPALQRWRFVVAWFGTLIGFVGHGAFRCVNRKEPRTVRSCAAEVDLDSVRCDSGERLVISHGIGWRRWDVVIRGRFVEAKRERTCFRTHGTTSRSRRARTPIIDRGKTQVTCSACGCANWNMKE